MKQVFNEFELAGHYLFFCKSDKEFEDAVEAGKWLVRHLGIVEAENEVGTFDCEEESHPTTH